MTLQQAAARFKVDAGDLVYMIYENMIDKKYVIRIGSKNFFISKDTPPTAITDKMNRVYEKFAGIKYESIDDYENMDDGAEELMVSKRTMYRYFTEYPEHFIEISGRRFVNIKLLKRKLREGY